MRAMRDHTKLRAFQLADQLALTVYAATRSFPDDERFGLTSQLRRAAVSIGANIVEGSARPSEADYVRFLTIAYGSAKELQYELSLAERLRYLTKQSAKELNEISTQTAQVLWALITALRNAPSDR
jgi:four helix bundle protein